MSDSESLSSYCLLSNGDLHFLPYSHSKDDEANYENYPLYSTFLNDKTISSFDSLPTTCNNNNNNNNNNNSSTTTTTTTATTTTTTTTTKNNNSNTQILKLLENYKSHAIYLPDHLIPLKEGLDQHRKIKSLLLKIFKHWNDNTDNHIQIKKLTGGITNILLECTYIGNNSNDVERVLVRTYGNGTDLIIDRDREFVSHLVLNSLNLAPSIHARFGNGLVYGYIEGCSLNFDQLSLPNLYPLIASKLACLHKLTNVHTIEDSLNRLKQKYHPINQSAVQSSIWSVLLDWAEKLSDMPLMKKLCLENIDILACSNPNKLVDILLEEIRWLNNELKNVSIQVTSHNDLLCGNIIIPSSIDPSLHSTHFVKSLQKFDSNPLSFIDYEYMMPAPRAFDIANHFMEWQGFDCDKDKIPHFTYNKSTKNYENDTVYNWCRFYLNAFHSSNPNLNPYLEVNKNHTIDPNLIQPLVNEIAFHYGMPGLYWGIWAGIQSEISLIDFDYSSYSCERLVEYWNWKRMYLSNKSI